MPSENSKLPSELTKDTDIYRENVDFWEKAWSPVKTAYTQMPDLPYLESIPAALKTHGCQTVLDLGCGSGWLSIYLARLGFSVTGIDIAHQAIHLARSWAKDEHLKITFETGDITDMSYVEDTFDAVVANSIFEHLTYHLAEQTIKELYSFIKPGGVFFGCFDLVGTGPGEFFELADKTHVYTDKGRKGMLLRCFSDEELQALFTNWEIISLKTIETGSRLLWAKRI
ncbi:MAG: methyltransferase domain-containing protein [Candidatus Obscuribacterales bacterium]|nr:methyltransferase domain-containing protein [Candidatus Obscuribacterales bacterium]